MELEMRRYAVIALLLGLTGCAQSYQPVVDTKGVDSAKYQQDLYECRQYAEQVSPAEKAGEGALIGAAGGAALGAVVGALTGGVGAGEAAAWGAGTGAVVGGGTGVYRGVESQQQIIDNCLRGRGYNVLN
jgi:outer membrane lipoprotein SlyB